MNLRGKIWFELDGRHVFGKGRAELLEAVEREGSIQAAARRMGMSYRRAWSLLKSTEKRCGEPLVETSRGGSDGGGARVTELGRRLLDAYRHVETDLEDMLGGKQDEMDWPDV